MSEKKNILGLIAFQGHCASAAVVSDGLLLAAVSEERFSRVKEDNSFPLQAIKSALKTANLNLDQIDEVHFAWNPYLSAWAHLQGRFVPSIDFIFQRRIHGGGLSRFQKFRDMTNVRDFFRRNFNISPKIKFINHHLSHSVSGVVQAGLKSALSFVMDGSGENNSISVFYYFNGTHEKINHVRFPHSIGYFYSTITQYLGFQSDLDEYKVMGLAGWGKPVYCGLLKKFYSFDEQFKLNLNYFSHHKDPDVFFGPALVKVLGAPKALTFQQKADIACSLQQELKDIVIKYITLTVNDFNRPFEGLCFSGGVFQNCVLNQAIRNHFNQQQLFFSPISSDHGTAIGAAFSDSVKNRQPTRFPTLYLGSEFLEQEILSALNQNNLIFKKSSDVAKDAAQLLTQGRIIGWFQGRSEFGPRALGNRSILADARIAGIKDLINSKIKQRESFRPFAPSILTERANDFFECSFPAPFMIETVVAREHTKKLIAEAIHVDGTARIQTVTPEANPVFYSLLKNFEQLTGLPIILNTSFNRNSEPIVNSPLDAINCFRNSKLDNLVIGDYIIDYKENYQSETLN